ncbi:DUF4229 domain-containing protein [Mycolicibacterium thermoresistibile]
MTENRSGARVAVDVLAYVAARLALVAALTVLIIVAGRLFGIDEFPVVVALLFALVVALPLGIWLFAPLRRRATAGMAELSEQRRKEREELRARMRGKDGPGPSN